MTALTIPPSAAPAPMTVADLITEAAALWHRLLTGLGVILPGVTLAGFHAFVQRIVHAAGALPAGLSRQRLTIDARLRAVPEFAAPLLAALLERERTFRSRGRAELAAARAEGVSVNTMKGRKGAASLKANNAKRKAAKVLEPA